MVAEISKQRSEDGTSDVNVFMECLGTESKQANENRAAIENDSKNLRVVRGYIMMLVPLPNQTNITLGKLALLKSNLPVVGVYNI
jgi:hypothetical protein